MLAIDDLLIVSMEDDEKVFDERLFYLFFIPLFSKFILKEKTHRHQHFSLLISLIGLIFLIIPIYIGLEFWKYIEPNILNFILGTNLSLFLVITKYVVEKYYISPLKISLITGIITIIINLIGYTIYGLIIDDFSFFTDCFNFSQVENKLVIIVYFLLYILFSIASQLTFFLSIFYFSPTLIMVTAIISPLFLWIAEIIFLKERQNKEIEIGIEITFNSIGYLITFFSTLIYNELIIFNCCGLNKNTKKFVNKRIYKELEQIKKEDFLSVNGDYSSIISDNK